MCKYYIMFVTDEAEVANKYYFEKWYYVNLAL